MRTAIAKGLPQMSTDTLHLIMSGPFTACAWQGRSHRLSFLRLLPLPSALPLPPSLARPSVLRFASDVVASVASRAPTCVAAPPPAFASICGCPAGTRAG